jgi:hypothetical protein
MERKVEQLITLYDLPIELFTLIITNDFETFKATIRAPGIAKLTTHEYCQNRAKNKFTRVTENHYGKYWFVNDIFHRIDGPAIEYANGDKIWYINGKLHRINGPAIECSRGSKYWYVNNNLHREDGPAEEFANGDKVWYINGKRHRVDGPAIEYVKGKKEWWIDGVRLNEYSLISTIKN